MEQAVERSWGSWQVLQVGPFYKVKQLIIKPHQHISLQYHQHRSETWCIVQGAGIFLCDGVVNTIQRGNVFTIQPLEWHRVTNTSDVEDLIAIEVQMGEICEESDIVRSSGK